MELLFDEEIQKFEIWLSSELKFTKKILREKNNLDFIKMLCFDFDFLLYAIRFSL